MIVLNLVLIGLVITLEPLPLTAFILILSSKGGVRKGAAFIFGWLLSLAIVIAFTVLVTGNNPPKPSTAPSLAERRIYGTGWCDTMARSGLFGPRPGPHYRTVLFDLWLLAWASHRIQPMTYALRGRSRALLTSSESALASSSQGAAGDGRWLLMAVREHLGGTRARSG